MNVSNLWHHSTPIKFKDTMEPTKCPECENLNAFFQYIDNKGAHYQCIDCSYEWCDSFDEDKSKSEIDTLINKSNDKTEENQ
jgi:Zn ribbon nucleic-acid-binding protein